MAASNFELNLDLVEAPTFFLVLCWPRTAKDLLQVCKCDDVHGYLMFSFCTCSFVFNCYYFFLYFLNSCDNTNRETS